MEQQVDLVLLKGFMPGFKKFLDAEGVKWRNERARKDAFFKEYFGKDQIGQLDEGGLRELIHLLWAFNGWTNKDWLLQQMLTSGLPTIRDTRVNNAQPWARKHWKTIEWNYRKAPHFDAYAGPLKEVYDRKWEHLWEMNVEIIRLILKWLEIDTPVKISGELGIEGQATELVLDICRKTGADAYLSGLHGRDYLDQPKFEEAGIELTFQDLKPVTYPQTPPDPFIPNLAIIDLIFNCGPQSRRLLLEKRDGRSET